MYGNDELPIGLGMELGAHPEAMRRFAAMNEEERQNIIAMARAVNSRSEIRELVRRIGEGMDM